MKTTQKPLDVSWYLEQELRIQEADAEARRARTAMRARFDPGHLYVVEFDSGVVKVGKTVNPAARLDAHAKAGLVRASWVSSRHLHCSKTERQLLAFCNAEGTLHGGREYFRGINFQGACTYAAFVVQKAIEEQGAT